MIVAKPSNIATTMNALNHTELLSTNNGVDEDAIFALMNLASTSKKVPPDSLKNRKGDEKEQTQETKFSQNSDQGSLDSPASTASSIIDSHSTQSNAGSAGNRFPAKLMSILNNPEYAKILSWSSDGQAFMFHDRKAFESIVLPSTFKDSKFDSFLRKLYRWGFAKCQVYSRVGRPAYRHEKFLRDFPNECKHMECRSKPKIQIPHFMNQHNRHGGARHYAPIFNQSLGSFSGLSQQAPLHEQSNDMPSTGMSAVFNYQNECASNMYADKEESFKSLSDYITSRRKHHQLVMNSAASLFKPEPVLRNSNVDYNDNVLGMLHPGMHINLGLSTMGNSTPPYHSSLEEPFQPFSAMTRYVDSAEGILDLPIIERGIPTTNHPFLSLSETMRIAKFERQLALDAKFHG